MFKKVFMWSALAVAVALLTFGAWSAVASAAVTPMLTWGFAYLDSIPVPHGTLVEIFIGADTVPSGSCETTILGRYGSCMVQGDDSRYGEALRYTVDGYYSDKIGPDPGVFGLENQEVSLHAYTDVVPPQGVHTWTFGTHGFLPRHLPDAYFGTVMLDSLQGIPVEVQGIYKFDDSSSTWLFWAPGAPGCTLSELGGGLYADYMVTVTGTCEWEIPLE